MLKKTFLLSVAAMLSLGAFAETLTPEAALQRATKSNGARKVITAQAQPKLAYTAKTSAGQPAVYVFNKADGGTLLLSANDVAVPMLGYTDSGTFDPNNIPPQLQYLLDEYAAQIAYAEENGVQPVSPNVTFTYPADWDYIAPLVKTQWDQNKPYCNMTPNSYPTGCVATAMAQVMNYWKYPEVGHGSISYIMGNTTTRLEMNFEQQPFQWNQMIDNYSTMPYTTEQANAVAYLMKACGYSVEMVYSASGSGSQVERSGLALIKNFGYNQNIKAMQRNMYTTAEWATELYNQLKNYGPVIYSGHTLGNLAHAWVCDGYDGQGYFHFNWGWSGLSDGFYSIDALIPFSQGTGGSNLGGYNFSQGMIANINTDNPNLDYEPTLQMTMNGNMSATNTASLFSFAFTQGNPGTIMNSSMVTLKPIMGVCVENLSNGTTTYYDVENYFYTQVSQNSYAWQRIPTIPEMGPGSYISFLYEARVRFDSQTMPDGDYKMQLVWKPTADAQWQNFVQPAGYHDYVNVNKSGTKYTITSYPIEKLVVESAEALTPLYFKNPCQFKFVISNPNDVEITQGLVPVLKLNGVTCYEGDSQLVTVGPHETVTKVFTYTFGETLSGGTGPTATKPVEYTIGAYDYRLLFDDNYTKKDYGDAYFGDLGKATMYRDTNSSSFKFLSMSIDNAAETTEENDEVIYGIKDFNNIVLTVNVEGALGFISSPLNAVVYTYNPTTEKDEMVAYSQTFNQLVYAGKGETAQATEAIHFKDYDLSQIYEVVVYYLKNGGRVRLGALKFAASTGVADVEASQEITLTYGGNEITVSAEAGLAIVTVYDLSGKQVMTLGCGGAQTASFNAVDLPKGVYIVRATDRKGEVKTLKFNK